MDELSAEDRALYTLQLKSLRSAYHSGILTVRHGETSTSFRSGAEMLALIERLEAMLADPLAPKAKRVRYITQMTRGL
jgi:hypothetical protein